MKNNNINIWSINMTYDAFVTLLSGLLLIIVLRCIYPNLNNIIYLFIAVMCCYNAYNINCMILGSCDSWARYIVISNIIIAIYMIYTKNLQFINSLYR